MSEPLQSVVETAARPLADQAARDRIREDLDTTLVVEAAAGTGKTTALVDRIISAVASGRAALNRIVAVTFTEKAAGELKLRLRTELERGRADERVEKRRRDNLTAALPHLEEARIGTIHSFCADLLRERPVEAGVDPMFEVAPEDVAEGIFEAAFDAWFERALAAPGPGLKRVLARRDIAGRDGPRPVLRAAAFELAEWRDFDSPWTHVDFERDRAIDALLDEVAALGPLVEAGEPDNPLTKSLDAIRRPVAEALRLDAVRGRDYDALEAVVESLVRAVGRKWAWRGWRRSGFGAVTREEAIARRAALRARLDEFRANVGASLAPLLREELWPVVGGYDELKRRAGMLDFLDLLLVARRLVRDNARVRAELQERFAHLFVDEFQDTDPLQAEIILLLAADDPAETDWRRVRPCPGKLFIVGDPKQSIYRFRRADVALYQRVKRALLERGAALEHLTVSFRATPEIQRMVNAAFAPLMARETETSPAYAELSPVRPDYPEQPAVVALPVPRPYGKFGKIYKSAIEESLPEAVAAFASWLLTRSGWTVTERENPGERAPIRPRHVCILFRRLSSHGRDVTREYVRALETRHLPHVLIKGGSFHEREEVEALRNTLGAIERPDDELAVFATMRGPLFSLSDAALLEFHETAGHLSALRPPPAEPSAAIAEVARALEVLLKLHRGRNRRPIADTIARLLAATRAHANVANWPTGEQALANIMRVMELARRYEARSGAISFRGFVDELVARAEREQAGEVPVVEEGTEGVRLMTVHRAKGLEFPVVILADITCRETPEEARRFIEPQGRLAALRIAGAAPRELLEHSDEELGREREEALRLLYVATTRARDLLVVPAVGVRAGPGGPSAADADDAMAGGWTARLGPALYPPAAECRNPLAVHPPGCPAFGTETVLERPQDGSPGDIAVAPGLHRPETGAHRVVWWDPAALELDIAEKMGLRQQEILKADEAGETSRRGLDAYERWRGERERMLANGARPAFRVTTATEHAARALAPEARVAEVDAELAAAVRVEQVARAPRRPGGKRFGALVHATLARVALDARPEAIAAAAAMAARLVGGTLAETEAAVEAVTNALRSPLIARAARVSPAELRRECPLAVKLADGTVVEGVLDLAFRERVGGLAEWTVVDFKTDAELEAHLEAYRAQLALYVRAVCESTREPACGVLLAI